MNIHYKLIIWYIYIYIIILYPHIMWVHHHYILVAVHLSFDRWDLHGTGSRQWRHKGGWIFQRCSSRQKSLKSSLGTSLADGNRSLSTCRSSSWNSYLSKRCLVDTCLQEFFTCFYISAGVGFPEKPLLMLSSQGHKGHAITVKCGLWLYVEFESCFASQVIIQYAWEKTHSTFWKTGST